jgi:hypothetical protein
MNRLVTYCQYASRLPVIVLGEPPVFRGCKAGPKVPNNLCKAHEVFGGGVAAEARRGERSLKGPSSLTPP